MKIFVLTVFMISPTIGLSAVTINQIDDFQSGSLHNWARGNFAMQPLNISTGGPAGSGDAFMRIASDGNGSNGKMLVYNDSRWTGNFTGFSSITMDLINLGTTSLSMRLSFRDTAGMSTSGFITNDVISLLPGSGWQTMVFDLSDLIAIETSASAPTYMANIAQMRILHAPASTTVLGENVAGILGVDNIAAVPEPSAAVLGGLGLLVLLRRRRD